MQIIQFLILFKRDAGVLVFVTALWPRSSRSEYDSTDVLQVQWLWIAQYYCVQYTQTRRVSVEGYNRTFPALALGQSTFVSLTGHQSIVRTKFAICCSTLRTTGALARSGVGSTVCNAVADGRLCYLFESLFIRHVTQNGTSASVRMIRGINNRNARL